MAKPTPLASFPLIGGTSATFTVPSDATYWVIGISWWHTTTSAALAPGVSGFGTVAAWNQSPSDPNAPYDQGYMRAHGPVTATGASKTVSLTWAHGSTTNEGPCGFIHFFKGQHATVPMYDWDVGRSLESPQTPASLTVDTTADTICVAIDCGFREVNFPTQTGWVQAAVQDSNNSNRSAIYTRTSPGTPSQSFTGMAQYYRVLHLFSLQGVSSGGPVDLVVANATHGHAAESVALTNLATLSVDGSVHAHTAGNLTLSTALALVTADALHAHVADTPTLSTGTSLAIEGTMHAHQADNVTLSTVLALAIDNALHAHTASNLDLSTAVLLAVDSASHAHAADNVVLDTTVGANLTIAGAVHAHVADEVVLSSETALNIASALHSHAAEQLSLSIETLLAVANATHGHTADDITLSTVDEITLAVADALHAHAADNLDLDLLFSVSLVISDATHGHIAQSVVLSLPGGYPDAGDVRQGVSYGPTGVEYVGTFKGGKGTIWVRRR